MLHTAGPRSGNSYTVKVRFEWDPAKAAGNLEKHGVSFHEAATALGDPLSTTFPDERHSTGERRFLTLGFSTRRRLVVVAHTEREDGILIIRARRATRRERAFYEQP
jgi:uncharacterized protein